MQENDTITVLRLTQWLEEWDAYDFDPEAQRRQPEPHFYVFKMSATKLRFYSDVYRRERSVEQVEGIQRAREESRTERIRRYIESGYPFGDLKQKDRAANMHLRKPGWLPTSIVVNILTQDDERRGKTIEERHMVRVIEDAGEYRMQLPAPDCFDPADLRPLEVIDGQHRLWAFEDADDLPEFEVPVVAFRGLDFAWQAYLFWSINISPVRINPSHAFDLYPLLRTQDWLEQTGEITVYREARAQEITEWVYRHPKSAWHDRISMLQRKGEPRVSQAAWVRSLIGSFFGTGRGRGRRGLFQCAYNWGLSTLDWERAQQIAFIVEFWNLLKTEVSKSEENWITLYRDLDKDAFTDRSSMLNQDMGVRAVHAVLNDIFYVRAGNWKLHEWTFGTADKTLTTESDIQAALLSLRQSHLFEYLRHTASAISGFDWRSLDGPNVRSSKEEMTKRAYRGSGGYTLLTVSVLTHVSKHGHAAVAQAAAEKLPATQDE